MKSRNLKPWFQASLRVLSATTLGTMVIVGTFADAAAETTKLRLADMFPDSHYLTKQVINPFMEKAEKLTGGKITFQHFPAGQLVKPQDMIDANENGLAEITSVVPLYSSDRLPLSGVIGLPGYNGDARSCTNSINKVTTELLNDEYANSGVHPLIVICTSPYQIMTTKPPVQNADDMAGLKIRSPGGVQEVVVDAIGAVPVSMPSTDIYTSLQRGTIDGVSASLDTMAQYSLRDIAKSVTTNGEFGFVSVAYIINSKTWSGFDSETRKQLEQAAQEAVQEYLDWADNSESDLIADWKSAGVDVYEIPENVLSAWAPKFETTRTEWARKLDSKGLAGNKVLNMWAENVSAKD